MDDKMKDLLEKIYDKHCIVLTKVGHIPPMFILVKNNMFSPLILENNGSMSFEQYADMCFNIVAEQNGDALILISEQKPFEDYESKDEYLTLSYMSKDGEAKNLRGKINYNPIGTKYIEEQTWEEKEMTTSINPLSNDFNLPINQWSNNFNQ